MKVSLTRTVCVPCIDEDDYRAENLYNQLADHGSEDKFHLHMEARWVKGYWLCYTLGFQLHFKGILDVWLCKVTDEVVRREEVCHCTTRIKSVNCQKQNPGFWISALL